MTGRGGSLTNTISRRPDAWLEAGCMTDATTVLTLAAAAPDRGEMIMAYGYADTVMPNGRLLNRDDLDKAFPESPVRVDHVSMHGAVLNSMASKQYGIDAKTKTPAGEIIVRKPGTNEPCSRVMETGFMTVFEQTPPLTPEQEIEGTKAAPQNGLALGRCATPPGRSSLEQQTFCFLRGGGGERYARRVTASAAIPAPCSWTK